MSVQPERDHAIVDWLRAEATFGAPDRLVEATRERLESTRQRRASWPARRYSEMNSTIRLALAAAAAIAVVAVVGVTFWPRSGGVATPGQTPSQVAVAPSLAAASASPQRLGPGPGALKPGPVLAEGLGASGTTTATFTVPEGWRGFAGSCVLPQTGTEAPDGSGICFAGVISALFSDPCHGTSGPGDVPVGPTVDDLATALGAQKAYTSTKPTDVTLGGYSGKLMDLRLPSDVASCDKGEFYPWSGSIYAQGPNNHWRLWILDVAGDRLIVTATDFPATSAADLAEQQAIVDSIQFQRH